MKLITFILLCCLSIAGFAQPDGRFENYFFNTVNKHRNRLHIDSLIYDNADYINTANFYYCEEVVYNQDSVGIAVADKMLDEDPKLVPYCIALTEFVGNTFEFEFRDGKDITEYDLYPDILLSNRNIKKIYEQFSTDSVFMMKISTGDSIGTNQVKRRMSIVSNNKIDNFRIIKAGRKKNTYGLDLIFVANVILYIKD
jgi:hypothetical protein